MMDYAAVMVFAGALTGGFVSGLSGFGTGLAALPLWLVVLPPVLAAPLVVVCSVVSQLVTLRAIWHAIDWRRVLPFIVGGLAGVPVGAVLLAILSATAFKLLTGIFLFAFSGAMLTRRALPVVTLGGRAADGIVGFGGGVLGGLAGLSGPLPIVWASLRGWGRDARRAVFQAFNLSILLFAFAAQAWAGFVTLELGRLVLIALPGTLLGSWIGRRIYARLDDDRFARLVLWLLLVSGISITLTTLLRGG